MTKLTHLLLLLAIAAVSATAAAAAATKSSDSEGAPLKKTKTNLRSLQSSQNDENENVFRRTSAEEESESDGDAGTTGDSLDGEEGSIEEYVFQSESSNNSDADNTVSDNNGDSAASDESNANSNENSATGDNANNANRQRNRNRNNTKTVVYNTYTTPNTLKTQTDVTVLFSSFHTKTTAEYGFALLFTAILAFSLETLVACRRDDWVGLKESQSSYLCSAIIVTMLHVLTLTIGIMLILIIAGSFNVGIIVAAILGSGVGHLVYTARRFKSDAKRASRRQSRSTAGESGDEHDVEKGGGSNASSFLNTTALTNLTTIPEDGFSNDADDMTAASSTIASRSTRRHHQRVHSTTRGGSRNSRSSRSSSQYGRASQRASQRLGGSRIPTTISLTSDDERQREAGNKRQRRAAAAPAPVPVATAIQEHQSNDLETPVPLVRSVSPIVSDMSDVIVYADDEATVRSEF